MEVQTVLQNVKFVQDQLSNSLTGFIFNYNIVENILHNISCVVSLNINQFKKG